MDKKKIIKKRAIDIFENNGYTVMSNLQIINQDGLALMAIGTVPTEQITLCEILLDDDSDEKILYYMNKLNFMRNILSQCVKETLEDIDINFSTIIIRTDTNEPTNEIKSELLTSNVNLVSIYRLDEFVPAVIKDARDDETYEAFVEYVKTVVNFHSTTPMRVSNLIVRDNIFYKSPREMSREVKKYVKGNDSVIDAISIHFYQHIESQRLGKPCKVKMPVFLAGPTGCGKSETLRRFAEICSVPIIRINTMDCTPCGWRGQSINDIIGSYINVPEDIESIKNAVIVLNEFDKITHNDQKITSSSGTDYSIDMQREILKLFDSGYEIVIDRTTNIAFQSIIRLPVTNLMICFDGAFSGMEKIIERRLNLKSTIGFGRSNKEESAPSYLLGELNLKDLEEWGYMPEVLGRIGQPHILSPMNEDIAYEILKTGDDNILNSHIEQCKMYGVEIEFTDEALRAICNNIIQSGTGFRAINPLLNKMLSDIYFNCDKYQDSKFYVNGNLTISNHEVNNNKLAINHKRVIENKPSYRLRQM